jgi:hypothetical protein
MLQGEDDGRPSGIATVIFLSLKLSRPPMVVKEQFPLSPMFTSGCFFLPMLDMPGISPNF